MPEEKSNYIQHDDSSGTLSYNVPARTNARGVIVTDKEHQIRHIDASICNLLGVPASDIIGRDIGEVVASILKHHFADPETFEREAKRLRNNLEETFEDVMQLVVPEKRILHRYSTPLLDENHNPVGRIEVYSDITKRRELEEANTALYKQISSAYEELKSTQEQLLQSEKLRAVGEIASGVAHDFNNTLGIILGNIQLLLRSADDPKVQSRLKAVEQAALDGAETVRRIREFTRIQPDEPLSRIDLSDLVTTVVDVMKPSWQSTAHAQDFRIDVEMDLCRDAFAAGIAPEIREVLANILLNAVQAMPGGGTIKITTGKSDGFVWVEVKDTGTGMTEEVRSRVFDPFFTTKGVEGTGLGMSVAYGIVKRHSGKISVDSIKGEGTTVTISLPAAKEGVQEVQKTSPETASAEPVHILVVDDEEMFAQVFVDMLSECGHAVCTVQNGSDAIERFKIEKFDLVFTDLGMPGMSGWQVAKSIKDIEPHTPVVLLTGWGTKVDEERLAESKVDMVLSKPVRMEDLSGIISTALSNRAKNLQP